MAITRVQEIQASGSTSTAIATYDAPTTAGNYLIAVVTMKPPGAFQTVFGWNYAVILNDILSEGNCIAIIYKQNAPATTSLSIDLVDSVNWVMFLTEYSGLRGDHPVDQTNSVLDNPSSGSSGAIIPTFKNSLVVVGFSSPGATAVFSSPSSPFTIIDQYNFPGLAGAYLEYVTPFPSPVEDTANTVSYSCTVDDVSYSCNGVIANFLGVILVNGNAILNCNSALVARENIIRGGKSLVISSTETVFTPNANNEARAAIKSVAKIITVGNVKYSVSAAIHSTCRLFVLGGFFKRSSGRSQATAVLTATGVDIKQTVAKISQNSPTSLQGAPFSLTVTFTTLIGTPITDLTGQVVFYDGGIPLVTVAVGIGGIATGTIRGLTFGNHSLYAAYLGGVGFFPSQTFTVGHMVIGGTTVAAALYVDPSCGSNVLINGNYVCFGDSLL